jgi:hypothetical protein
MATNDDTAAAPPAAAAHKIDFLEDDPISVPGQHYVLLSVVSPSSNQRAEKCGVKIRGVFATRQEADAHAKKLQRLDPHYDIFCADVGKWLLLPPDISGIEDQEYQEDYLNNLMKTYRENQELAKQHFEERKRSVLEDGLDKHLLPHERHQAPEGYVPPSTSAAATIAEVNEGAGPSNAAAGGPSNE